MRDVRKIKEKVGQGLCAEVVARRLSLGEGPSMRIVVGPLLVVCVMLTLEACGGGQPGQGTPAGDHSDASGAESTRALWCVRDKRGLGGFERDRSRHTHDDRDRTLGKRPRGIRVSPDRTQLYIALSGSPISPPGVDESKLPPPDRGRPMGSASSTRRR